ncbi:hypothetical protein [Undibacterium sp.]|jgi:HTH-type transcriptional regulator/antitoxin HigA|uniref:hypothetical protein n=1 Tax=Undibacterium sp. TaxID=1914977 RepID=UPI002C18B31A|nr:hypothetical protein [Undibacterium sp.]HTD05225.1 hypothetical protein [Undibacterium sp.]
MDRNAIEDISARFQALTELVPLHPIRTQKDYDSAVTILNQLLDAGGADECSSLADLVNLLGSLIGDYEDAQNP